MANKQRFIQLRTMPYEDYLKTSEWLAIRDQALYRDGHRCRACNSDKDLNVHHRTYERRGCEDLNDLSFVRLIGAFAKKNATLPSAFSG